MPIDFNPHFAFNTNKHMSQKIVHNHFVADNQPVKDTFSKSITVTDSTINSNYDGIKIDKKSFGKIQKTGEDATLYTITNKNGASVDLSTFGATITSIKVPDKNGKIIDVTQGYDNVTPYETAPVGHAGGTIGPVANKINNGEFTINGKTFELEKNKDNGKTHCHGVSEGFDVKNWKANILKEL